MYNKNKSKQIVVRVSDLQYDFLKNYCESWGCSLSDFIRALIDYYISASEIYEPDEHEN